MMSYANYLYIAIRAAVDAGKSITTPNQTSG